MGLWSRLRDGAMRITPLQNLRGQRAGCIGQIIGMLVGLTGMLLSGLWFWGIFILFSIGILVLQWIGIEQQIKKLEELSGP